MANLKITELYKRLKENEDKLEIIEKIQQLHPGLGTDLKWSYYYGGMADTGDWLIDKLLSIPKNALEIQYQIWTK
jgi:thiamine monophosphate kinase